MKTIKHRKGNYEYYLNHDLTEGIYSFVVYVKIKSEKRKLALKCTREKIIDEKFKNISDEMLKLIPEKEMEILKLMIKDINNE
ncbi:TPA: hypothetical protein ACHWC7_004047 [Providencia stuartii]|uniref:hypothetical protein n=1 Tax=Proteus mirabilis TaxID=584 RepID=UPI000BA093F0|nr:hypothetical protein [Proteus mirabilis]OZS64630.1 hypothetical protein CHI96_19025 [Proteus mirabilis]OZS65161.1 hypothetical protein CHI96_16290 [Proteus mirabilis]